jgi:hypothetical protein
MSFLKALKIENVSVVKTTAYEMKTIGSKSSDFRYHTRENSITFHQHFTVLDADGYKQKTRIFLYRVIQSQGEIFVETEDNRKILVLRSKDSILKIEDSSPHYRKSA